MKFSEAGGAVVGVASSQTLEMPPVIEETCCCTFSRLVYTPNVSCHYNDVARRYTRYTFMFYHCFAVITSVTYNVAVVTIRI